MIVLPSTVIWTCTGPHWVLTDGPVTVLSSGSVPEPDPSPRWTRTEPARTPGPWSVVPAPSGEDDGVADASGPDVEVW